MSSEDIKKAIEEKENERTNEDKTILGIDKTEDKTEDKTDDEEEYNIDVMSQFKWVLLGIGIFIFLLLMFAFIYWYMTSSSENINDTEHINNVGNKVEANIDNENNTEGSILGSIFSNSNLNERDKRYERGENDKFREEKHISLIKPETINDEVNQKSMSQHDLKNQVEGS